MKRKMILPGLCLIILLGLFTAQASAEQPAWAAAYEQILTGLRIQISEEPVEYSTPELWYLLYDIDKDSTPELIVKTGTCEADYHGAIYTFRDGRAFAAEEELGLGHSSFYSDPGENGVILMYGHMGYASAERVSLTENGCVGEELYEDNLNERLQEDPGAEYVYPGDVIPGSVYLTLCRGELTLPLTRYEEICRCLEGDLPAAAQTRYPNGDDDFFDRLIARGGEVWAVTGDGFTKSPGKIGFQELLQKGAAAEWMQGNLRILSSADADLNGDGKLERVLAVSDGGGSEMRIVLSEQDGTVYAYLMNYRDGYVLDPDGCLRSVSYFTTRYRLIFDGKQAFLLMMPDA